MIKKGYVEIPEGQVHLRRVEGIGPPIVLLHRTPASSVSFEAMLARFDGRRAAIAFDTPGFGQSFRPAGRPSTVDYARWFLARLRMIATRLETNDFLAADRFTAADISVGYALMLAHYTGLADYFAPSVMRYWERLQQRAGFKSARAAEDRACDAAGISHRMAKGPRFELAPKA